LYIVQKNSNKNLTPQLYIRLQVCWSADGQRIGACFADTTLCVVKMDLLALAARADKAAADGGPPAVRRK
jgi:hypothetical protein